MVEIADKTPELPKACEIFYMLHAIQCGSIDLSGAEYIGEFLRAQVRGLPEAALAAHVEHLRRARHFNAESECHRMYRLVDFLEFRELSLLFKFLDVFLKKHPVRSYFANQLLVYCLRLIQRTSGFYITKRNYPDLFVLQKDLEACDLMVSRLNILRSQVADMIRAEVTPFPQIQLWEIIIILTSLHCCHSKVQDEDLSIYNIVIRYARASLQYLSFQQVMRVCRNIQELTRLNKGMHALFISNVDQYMDFKEKRDLVSNLLLLRRAVKDPSDEFLHYIQSVVVATRFNEDEMGRLVFRLTEDASQLPPHFRVLDIKNGAKLVVADGRIVEGDVATGSVVSFEKSGAEKILVHVMHEGHETKREVGALDEQLVESVCFLFKPKTGEVCYYKPISSTLHVKNIQLSYRGNNILNDVSFAAKTGEMIAVVGPSGCGKSTMLTMLAGILEYSGGDIYFDGRRITTVDEFAAISTYIPQDDILFRELTVHESIDNSVRLKVSATENEYRERLASTIQVLGLERTEFLKIGNEGEKGISGGQRKRVNIGTTIVADMKPILLFDEPTSGLDPATDLEIMQLLCELSRRGHIVLCVTHNLSDESMGYFDKLLVLGRTGQVQFFGKNQRALFFFSINTTQVLFQKMKDARGLDYHDKYFACPEHANLKKEIESSAAHFKEAVHARKGSSQSGSLRLPGFVSNTGNFIKREAIRKLRDPQYLLMSLIQPVLIGLFICWNFDGPMPNALFSLMTASLWIGAISSVREINSEIPQLKRDYMYGTSLCGYFLAKIGNSFAFSAVQVFILMNIIVLFGGYLAEPFSFSYGAFLFNILLLNLFGICLGLFLSSAIRSTLAAVGILPVILIPVIIMGGALIRHTHTDGMQWQVMKYNPLRIAYEASLSSAKTILRPQLEKLEPRDPADAEKQLAEWRDYETRVDLYDRDPAAYQEKYGETGDINNIFSDYLEDKQDSLSPVQARPSAPSKVQSPGLLVHQRRHWLEGYSLLEVDRHPGLTFFDFWKKDFYEPFELRAPKAFSDKIGAQGAIGMFRSDGPERDLSIYAPAEYILITLAEILLLCVGMYTILRVKLASKF